MGVCICAEQPDQATFSVVTEDRKLRLDAEPLDFQDIFTSQQHAEQIKLSEHWVSRLGANTAIPPVFIDGLAIQRDENWMQVMSMKLMQDLQIVQQGVFMGTILEDSEWILGLVY